MKPADFLAWVQKQKAQAREVVSCYEAGPTGFWLHRRLTALGVRNYVVCPTRLDERHCGVANDRTDASKTEEAAGLTPSGRECYGNDTTKRDGGDRPRSLAARFPSFQFSQETDATDRNQTKKPTDRHN